MLLGRRGMAFVERRWLATVLSIDLQVRPIPPEETYPLGAYLRRVTFWMRVVQRIKISLFVCILFGAAYLLWFTCELGPVARLGGGATCLAWEVAKPQPSAGTCQCE
jgi:hypothetical protein